MIKQIKHFLYWLRSHTYNRYHIINCKDPSNDYYWGWCDRDYLILYACFKILKDFVEKEYAGSIDSDAHSHTDTHKEIFHLYEWWTKIRPTRNKSLNVVEAQDEDQKYLLRLIAIRSHLWT